jgi:hypothetical protein
LNETEDTFVQRTKEAFANLGFANSFSELRCREIYARLAAQPKQANPVSFTVAEQLPLL